MKLRLLHNCFRRKNYEFFGLIVLGMRSKLIESLRCMKGRFSRKRQISNRRNELCNGLKFPFLKNKGYTCAKIEVFVRYCYYSKASAHKGRLKSFSHEKCFENLMQTADFNRVGCTFLLDTHFANPKPHFVKQQTKFPVIEIDAGQEGKSFLALLDHVMDRRFSDETILYFLEDDYLHRKGWGDVLLEGFSLREADYVTLFDHRDKYFHKMYENLDSRLFHTATCHWRTTPSTTNTYAMRHATLKQDIEIHRQFSKDHTITQDHEKFLALGKKGRTLISAIPGWATHSEPDFASPCFNWTRLLSLMRRKTRSFMAGM